MDELICRKYVDASFLYHRGSRRSCFFEGPLAETALSFAEDLNCTIPECLVQDFLPGHRKEALSDLEEMRNAVSSLLQASGSVPDVTDVDAEPEDSMRALSSYAVRTWQVLNVNMELTYCCNQRCQWCYLGDFSARGLSRERIRAIAGDIVRAGAVFVLATGGEIFTRADAVDVLADLEKAGLVVEIKTNGTLLRRESIEQLSCLRPLDLQISVYETSTGFSSFTRSFYPFDRVLENTRLLVAAGLPVTLSVLVGLHNIDALDALHEKLVLTGANVFYSPYMTPGRDQRPEVLELRLGRNDLESRFLPFLEKVGVSSPPRQYRDCSEGDDICYAGRDQIAIDPDGVVFPCLDLRLPLGDLKSESLGDVLARRRGALERFKLGELSQCLACPDRDYCDSCIGIALLENGDFRVPSTHKCDITHFYARGRR